MSHRTATKELRNMQLEDLKREIVEKKLHVAKMRVDIDMKVEKDTAKFAEEKKNLARLLTILNEAAEVEEKKPVKKLNRKPKATTITRP